MLIRLGGLFFVIALVFWLWALFDSITADDKQVRNLPKLGWILIVLIGFEVGAAFWVWLGRPRKQAANGRSGLFGPGASGPFSGGNPLGRGPSGGGQPGRGPLGPRGPRGSGPVGPDDDPDFLKGL